MKYTSSSSSNPLWMEATMIASVVGSWIGTWIFAQKYLTEKDSGNIDYISAAIPFFTMLIFMEMLLLWLSSLPSQGSTFEFADAWSSLASGSAQRMWIVIIFKIFVKLFVGGSVYTYIWNNFALYHFPLDSPISWLGILFTIDFLYYWAHRSGHQIAFLWAGHSIHHSSEHYNLTTALRQSIWQHFYDNFSLLFAAFFFPPSLYAVHSNWNTLYQFWVHTCCIRRLGPIEWVFMTPSHHRVHHDRRVHKNYGGVFVIWDRIFGTFHDELEGIPGESDMEICAFGTMLIPDSWSDAVLQTHVWRTMISKAFRSGPVTVAGVVRAAVVGPGFSTTTMPRSLHGVATPIRFHTHARPALKVYIAVHFAVLLMASYVLMAIPVLSVACSLYCVAIIVSLALQGLLLDLRPAAAAAEAVRCFLVGLVLASPELVKDLPLLSNLPHEVALVFAGLFGASCALWCAQSTSLLAPRTLATDTNIDGKKQR